jgi:hypothetical protein
MKNQINLQALASEVGGTVVQAAGESDSQRFVRILKSRTGIEFACDKQLGGYKISTTGGRDVSPRLPKKQMETWVFTFVDGFDAAKHPENYK